MSDPADAPTAEPAAEPAAAAPPADPWRIPVHCHGCGAAWDVSRRAFRTGGVLHCTGCHAPYVVQTTMFRDMSACIAALEARGVAGDSAAARAELDALSRTFRPPGMPRPTAGVFG